MTQSTRVQLEVVGTPGCLLLGVTETTADGHSLDFGIWYQTATSSLDKGPLLVMGSRTRGLTPPPPPQGSFLSLLGLDPQGLGPGEPAVTPPSGCPQAGLSTSAAGE